MIRLVLAVVLLAGCGSLHKKSKAADAPAAATPPTFTDVDAVLKAKCAYSGCHGAAANGSFVFVDSQAAFDAEKDSLTHRLTLGSADGVMPPPESPKLAAAEQTLLLTYLAGVKNSASAAAASPAAAPPAPAPAVTAGGKSLSVDPMAALQNLPKYPAALQLVHKLAEKMHNETAVCAGFAAEEAAELETFDELSAAGASAQEAQAKLQPLLDAVKNKVVPALVSKLGACRTAQDGGAEDLAMKALMLGCFHLTREDFPASNAGGSTPFGDPLRLPSPDLYKASPECTAAAQAATNLL